MEGRKRLDSNAREKREEWNTCAMRAKVGAACGEEDGHRKWHSWGVRGSRKRNE